MQPADPRMPKQLPRAQRWLHGDSKELKAWTTGGREESEELRRRLWTPAHTQTAHTDSTQHGDHKRTSANGLQQGAWLTPSSCLCNPSPILQPGGLSCERATAERGAPLWRNKLWRIKLWRTGCGRTSCGALRNELWISENQLWTSEERVMGFRGTSCGLQGRGCGRQQTSCGRQRTSCGLQGRMKWKCMEVRLRGGVEIPTRYLMHAA